MSATHHHFAQSLKLALYIFALLVSHSEVLHSADTRYAPDWAGIAPKRIMHLSNTQNDTLASAVAALRPGDQLVIAAGTYRVDRTWHIEVSGTAEAPIWIVAEKGAQVILTRPDAKQNAREGMILANNILYSRDKIAMNFPKGKEGVTITGNIILGDAPKQGTKRGRGLEDFVSMSWDGEKHDATPTAEAPFDHSDSKYHRDTDFRGTKRIKPLSGALTR